jgi:hypothetical protein
VHEDIVSVQRVACLASAALPGRIASLGADSANVSCNGAAAHFTCTPTLPANANCKIGMSMHQTNRANSAVPGWGQPACAP